MADDDLNRIEAAPGQPQAPPGALPERLRRRYLTEPRGDGLAFFTDASSRTPVFRDHGQRLSTQRNDPSVVRDMVAIAQYRGWTGLQVRGATAFRRELWLEAEASGISVRGYAPTVRDRQVLDRRKDREEPRPMSRADPLKVVEAVVRERVPDPQAQIRIVERARSRLLDWLTRDLRPQPARTRDRHR